MTIILLPVSTDPAQSFTTQLVDRKITFDLRWNDRNRHFECDLIEDSTKEYLLQGLLLVLGADLLDPFNLNLGRMIVMDTSGAHQEPTLENFGETVLLVWISADEPVPETVMNIPAPYVLE